MFMDLFSISKDDKAELLQWYHREITRPKTRFPFVIWTLWVVSDQGVLPQAAVQCSQSPMTLRPCLTQWLLGANSWAAAQPLSTSSCVNTRAHSPFHNLGSESPRRKLIHSTWRLSWPDVPCQISSGFSLPLWTSTAGFSSTTADFTCQSTAGG